jgi:quinol monooxygenase YgiN
MTVKEESVEKFTAYLDTVKDDIKAFNGCEHLDVFRDKENKSIYFSYSIWKSEWHLNRYRKSPFFQETWGTLKQWFSKDTQAWTVDNVFDKEKK